MKNKLKSKKLKYFIISAIIFLMCVASTIAVYSWHNASTSTISLAYGGSASYRTEFHNMVNNTFNSDLNCVEADVSTVHNGTYKLGSIYTTRDQILGYIRANADTDDWTGDIFTGQEQQMGLWYYIYKGAGPLANMGISLKGEDSTEGKAIYDRGVAWQTTVNSYISSSPSITITGYDSNGNVTDKYVKTVDVVASGVWQSAVLEYSYDNVNWSNLATDSNSGIQSDTISKTGFAIEKGQKNFYARVSINAWRYVTSFRSACHYNASGKNDSQNLMLWWVTTENMPKSKTDSISGIVTQAVSLDKYIDSVTSSDGTTSYASTRQASKDPGTTDTDALGNIKFTYGYTTHNIDKKDNPVTIRVGDTVKYAIDVYNEDKSVDNKPITIIDTLPLSSGIDVSVSGAGTGSVSGNTLTITTNNLTTSTEKITINVSIKFNSFAESTEDNGALHNIAKITKIGEETNDLSNNNGSESKQQDGDWVKMNNISLEKFITQIKDKTNAVTYNSVPDRANACDENTSTKKVASDVPNTSLIKLNDPLRVRPGDTVTYTIKVRNLGSKPALNVTVYDLLPVLKQGSNEYLLYDNADDTASSDVHVYVKQKGGSGAKATTELKISEIMDATGKLLTIPLSEIKETGSSDWAEITITVKYNDRINICEGNIINGAWTLDAATEDWRTEDHDYLFVEDVSLQKYISSRTPVDGEPTIYRGAEDRIDWIAKEDDPYTANPSFRRSSKTNKKEPVEIAVSDTVNYYILVYNNTANILDDVEVEDWCENPAGIKGNLSIDKIVVTTSTHDVHPDEVTPSYTDESPTYTYTGGKIKVKVPELPKYGYAIIYMKATFTDTPQVYNTVFTNHAELVGINSLDTDYRYKDEDYVIINKETSVSLEKYITEVNGVGVVPHRDHRLTFEDHDALNKYVERSQTSWEDDTWYKENNAVVIKPGDLVKYNIVVYNNSVLTDATGVIVNDYLGNKYGVNGIAPYVDIREITVDGTVVQIGDDNCKRSGDQLILSDIDVPRNDNVVITLTVKFDTDTNATGTLINSADVELIGNVTNYRTEDADFVKLANNVSMQKYITGVGVDSISSTVKVHSETLGTSETVDLSANSREDTYAVSTSQPKTHKDATMKNFIKQTNPVEVEQGNTVQYTIPIYSNITSQTIFNPVIVDTLPLKNGDINTVEYVTAKLDGEPIWAGKPENSEISFELGKIDFTETLKKKTLVVEIKFASNILNPTDKVLLENKAKLVLDGNETTYRLEDSDYILLSGSLAKVSMQKYIKGIIAKGDATNTLLPADPTREDMCAKTGSEKPYGVGHPNREVIVNGEKVTKFDIPKGVSEGQKVVYTIKVLNNGGFDDSEGVQITDNLTELVSYMDNPPASIQIYNVTDGRNEEFEYNSATKEVVFPKNSKIFLKAYNKDNLSVCEKEYTLTIKLKDTIAGLSGGEIIPNDAKVVGANISTSEYRIEDSDYIKLSPPVVSLEKIVREVSDAEITDGRTALIDRWGTMYNASSTQKIALGYDADTTKNKESNPVLINSGEKVTFTVRVYNNTDARVDGIKIKDTITLNDAKINGNVEWRIVEKEYDKTSGNYVQVGPAKSNTDLSTLNNQAFGIPASHLELDPAKLSYADIDVMVKLTSDTETTVINTAELVDVSSSGYRIKDSDIVKIPVSSTDVSLQKFIVDTENPEVQPTNGVSNRINKYAKNTGIEPSETGVFDAKNFEYGVTTFGQHYGYSKVVSTKTITVPNVGRGITKAAAEQGLKDFKKDIEANAGEGTTIKWVNDVYHSEKTEETGYSDWKVVDEATYNMTPEKDIITGEVLKYKEGDKEFRYRTRTGNFITGYSDWSSWSAWIPRSSWEYTQVLLIPSTRRQIQPRDPIYYIKTIELKGITHYWYDCTYIEEKAEIKERDTARVNEGKTLTKNGFKIDDMATITNGGYATFSIVVYNNDATKPANSIKVKDSYTKTGTKIVAVGAGIGNVNDVNNGSLAMTSKEMDASNKLTFDNIIFDATDPSKTVDIKIIEIPANSAAVINVVLQFNSNDPEDLIRANGAWIDSVSGIHSTTKYRTADATKYRTADADYIQIGIPSISLQKYIVGVDGKIGNLSNKIVKTREIGDYLVDGGTMTNRMNYYAVNKGDSTFNGKGIHNNRTYDLIRRTSEETLISVKNTPIADATDLKNEYMKSKNPVITSDHGEMTFFIKVYNNSEFNANNINLVDILDSKVSGLIREVGYNAIPEGSEQTGNVAAVANSCTTEKAAEHLTYSMTGNTTNIVIDHLDPNSVGIIRLKMEIIASDSVKAKDNKIIPILGVDTNIVEGDILSNQVYINNVGVIDYRNNYNPDPEYRTADADYFMIDEENISMQKYITNVYDETAGGEQTVRGVTLLTLDSLIPVSTKYRSYVNADGGVKPTDWSRYVGSDVSKYINYVSDLDLINGGISELSPHRTLANNEPSWISRNLYQQKCSLAIDSLTLAVDSTAYTVTTGNEKVTYTLRAYNNKSSNAYNVRLGDYNEADTTILKIAVGEYKQNVEAAVYNTDSLAHQYETLLNETAGREYYYEKIGSDYYRCELDGSIYKTYKFIEDDGTGKSSEEEVTGVNVYLAIDVKSDGKMYFTIPEISGDSVAVINIYAGVKVPQDGNKYKTLGNYAWLCDRKLNTSRYRNVDADWLSVDDSTYASIEKTVLHVKTTDRTYNDRYSRTATDSDGKPLSQSDLGNGKNKAVDPVDVSTTDTVTYQIKIRGLGSQLPDYYKLIDDYSDGNGKIVKIQTDNGGGLLGAFGDRVKATIYDAKNTEWADNSYWAPDSTLSNCYISSKSIDNTNGKLNLKYTQIRHKYTFREAIGAISKGLQGVESEINTYITVEYTGLEEDHVYKNVVELETKGEKDATKYRHKDADYIKANGMPQYYDVSLQKYVIKREGTNRDASNAIINDRSAAMARSTSSGDGDNKHVSDGISTKTSSIKYDAPVNIHNNDTVTYKIEVHNDNNISRDIEADHHVKVIDSYMNGELVKVALANKYDDNEESAILLTNATELSPEDREALSEPFYITYGNTVEIDLKQLLKDETRAIFITLKHTDMMKDTVYRNTAKLELTLNSGLHRLIDSDYVKASEVYNPNVSLQKFITKVNDDTKDTYGNDIESRSGWIVETTPAEGENGAVTADIPEVNKYKSGIDGAVKVKPGDKVTYRIELHNNNSEEPDVIIADAFPYYGGIGDTNSVINISNSIKETHISDSGMYVKYVSLPDAWEFMGDPTNGTKKTIMQKVYNSNGTDKRTTEYWEQNAYYNDFDYPIKLKSNETVIIEIEGIVKEDIGIEEAQVFKNTARIITADSNGPTGIKHDFTNYRTLDSDYIWVEPNKVNISLQKYITERTMSGAVEDRSGWATQDNDIRTGVNKDVTESIKLVDRYKMDEAVKIVNGETVTYKIELHNNRTDARATGIKVKDILPHDEDGLIGSVVSCTHPTYSINGNELIIEEIDLEPEEAKEIFIKIRFNNLKNGVFENAAELDTGDKTNITEYRTTDSDWIRATFDDRGVSLQKYIVKINGDNKDIDGNSFGNRSGRIGLNSAYESDLSNSGVEYEEITYNNPNKNSSVLDVTRFINAKTPAKDALKITSGSSVTYRVWVYNNTEDITYTNVVIEDQVPYYYYRDGLSLKRTTAAEVTSVKLHNAAGDLIGDLNGDGIADGDLLMPGNELFKIKDAENNLYSYTHAKLVPNDAIFLEITLDFIIDEDLWTTTHDDNPDEELRDILPNRASVIYTNPENDTPYRSTDFDYVYPIVDNTVDVSLEKVVWTVNNTDESKTIKGLDSSSGTGKNRINGIGGLESESVIRSGWQSDSNLTGKKIVWRATNVSMDPDIASAYTNIFNNNTFDNNKIKNKTLDPVHAEFGDTVTFRIYVYNNKGRDAHDVTVLDRLPYFNYDKSNISVFKPDTDKIKVYNNSTGAQVTEFEVGSTQELNDTYWNNRTMNESKGDKWKDYEFGDDVCKNNKGLWGIEVKIDTLPANESYYIEIPIKLDSEHSQQWSDDFNGGITAGDTVAFDENLDKVSDHIVNNEASVIFTKETNDTEFRIADYDYLYLKRYSVSIEKYISAGVNTDITRAGVPIYADGHQTDKYNNVGVTSHDKEVTYTIRITNTAKCRIGGTSTTEGTEKTIHSSHEIEDDFGAIYVDVADAFSVIEVSGTTFNYEIVDNGGLTCFENGDTGTGNEVGTTYKLGAKESEKVIPIAPGKYIEIKLKIKVTEFNISLDILENDALIKGIQNKNEQKVHDDDGSYNNLDTDWLEMEDITINGVVWNDVAIDKASSSYDGKFDTENEVGLEGIKVHLYRIEGENAPVLLDTVETDENGHYVFDYEFIKAEPQPTCGCNRWTTQVIYTYDYSYYVVFEYDGVTYTSTYTNHTKTEDGKIIVDPDRLNERKDYIWNYADSSLKSYSKATEDNPNGLSGLESRSDFNGRYETIDPENPNQDIKYITQNPVDGGVESNYIVDDTIQASSDNIELIEDGEREAQLGYINLGLRGKEILDLEILSDVEQIEITVNDIKGVYKYSNVATLDRKDVIYEGASKENPKAKNEFGNLIEEDAKNTIPEVVTGNYVDELVHDLRITDTKVSEANNGNAVNKYDKTGIQVRVVYKIVYKNAGKTNSCVDQFFNFYDKNYKCVGISDANGYVAEPVDFSEYEAQEGLYNIVCVTLEHPVESLYEPGTPFNGLEQSDVSSPTYIAFDLIDAESKLATLDVGSAFATFNMVEIKKYTNYDNKTYTEYNKGLIDKDSAPMSSVTEKVRTKADSTIGNIEKEGYYSVEETIGEPTTVDYYFDRRSISNYSLANLKYEDDTHATPTILLKIIDARRKLEGIVFEDSSEPDANKVRSGDGLLGNDSGGNPENRVEGATVLLIELKESDPTKYTLGSGEQSYLNNLYDFNDDNENSYDSYNGIYYPIKYKTTTDANGYYSFQDFLPGIYILRYYYGDTEKTLLIGDNNLVSYNGEDYQSTINKGISTRPYYWYMAEGNEADPDASETIKKKNRPDFYSVAEDDVDRRISVSRNVGGYYRNDDTIMYSTVYEDNSLEGTSVLYADSTDNKGWVPGFSDDEMEKLNRIRNNVDMSEVLDADKKGIMNKTAMYSDTQAMQINVEKTDNYLRSERAPSFSTAYTITDMNYGIATAPTTDVELKKKITAFTLKDSTGINTIVEGEYKLKPGSTDEYEWTVTDSSTGSTLVVPGLSEASKFIDIQIEDDKLQGAKLQVTYTIEVKADQELDFDKSIVTISSIGELYDYVDNDFAFITNAAQNAHWEVDVNKSYINLDHYADSTKPLYTLDGSDKVPVYTYTTVVKATSGNGLLEDLSDGAVHSEQIVLEKILSSNNVSLARVLNTIEETYEYTNFIEVTKLNYKGNTDANAVAENYNTHIFRDAIRRTDTTRDPYTFDANDYEYVMVGNWQHDTAISGTITIHPPTGDSGIAMSYYIIALITLGVVATGAIVAKRKIKKK